MELAWSACLSSICLSIFVLIFIINRIKAKHGGGGRPPPGPPGWPIIGNILDLGSMPHQQLYKLRDKYGPVIWLRLGSVDTMVVQSPNAASELFKNHDLAFCDRKVPDALTAWNYNEGALALSAFGVYWRVLRRLYASEFLVHKKINDRAELREECAEKMVRWIEDDSATSLARGGSGEVQISTFLLLMSFNLVGRLILSKDLCLDSQSVQGSDFFNAMEKVMELAGTPNIADFFPLLKWFDPLRIKSRMIKNMGRARKIVENFVRERILEKEQIGYSSQHDLLDALLDYKGDGKEGPDNISEKNVVIAILEMFFGGLETTSSVTEWAMTELLRMPSSMAKVREELDRVVGPNKNLKESDFDQLPYLQAVVKETLRLHPSVPLLVPRNAMCDTNYMGFFIPKGTQVYVNAWAIGRDSEYWDEPLSFRPERFIGSNVDFKGQNFEFLPFGSGRRVCVGYPLAHRILMLGLASLLHSFDWEVIDFVSSADMGERMGITLRKLIPLKFVPKRRACR